MDHSRAVAVRVRDAASEWGTSAPARNLPAFSPVWREQRVDDHNDRFVSRNCHNASDRSHVFWALFIDFFSGLPMLRDAQPGTEKNELSSAQGFRNGCFIPHIFDKNNTALFLWPMISVLGHRSEGTNTGLGPFRPFRAAKANTAIFKLPGECGSISRSIKNYPKDTSPKDTRVCTQHS